MKLAQTRLKQFCVSMSNYALKSPRYVNPHSQYVSEYLSPSSLSLSLSLSLPSTYIVSIEDFGCILEAPPDCACVRVEVFHGSLNPLLLESFQLLWIIVIVESKPLPPWGWSLQARTIKHTHYIIIASSR